MISKEAIAAFAESKVDLDDHPLTNEEKARGLLIFLAALGAVLLMVFWKPHQLPEELHTSKLHSYNVFITSPLYTLELRYFLSSETTYPPEHPCWHLF